MFAAFGAVVFGVVREVAVLEDEIHIGVDPFDIAVAFAEDRDILFAEAVAPGEECVSAEIEEVGIA